MSGRVSGRRHEVVLEFLEAFLTIATATADAPGPFLFTITSTTILKPNLHKKNFESDIFA